MQAIKVAHLTTVDTSLRYLLLNQLRSIQQAGYEVYGIATPGAAVAEIEAAGVRFLPTPLVRASKLTPAADLRAFWHLYRLFRRERFTIIHTHTAKPDLFGQMAARLAGTPVVLSTLHGFYFHEHMPANWRGFFISLARIGGRFSDVILSQNPEDLETARSERIWPEKMRYLGNGIDVRRFDRARVDPAAVAHKRRELGIREGTPVVGFVGRLVADKGVLEVLQAARLVREQAPEARFLLVGMVDRAKQDAITPETARSYGVGDTCIFTGQREDVPDLLAMMDIFTLPSHREAFPRAPMEAAAMGLPAVVTNVRGCRTVVDDGRTGMLVPQKDAPALASAILHLLQHPEVAHRMGEAGYQKARQEFDEVAVFEKVKMEYARLLGAKGLPAPAAAEAYNPLEAAHW